MAETVVCALYRFITLDDYLALRLPLLKVMLKHNVRGTLLLAREGINGTIAGSREAIDAFFQHLENDNRLANVDYKESFTDKMPFLRTRVKSKNEIITLGVEGVDPTEIVGTYVKPEDWNSLITDPTVVLVDTRNYYEFQIGTFKNALNPNTKSFREFPRYVRQHLDPDKHKKVAMFCTGGIRCEKSASYMKKQGFEKVYQLEGGILKYLKDVPTEKTLWGGECFVFDERVTVNHNLEKGGYDQCHACRFPITEEDKLSDKHELGISCLHCFDKTSNKQKERFRERKRQIFLNRKHGKAHMGTESTGGITARQVKK